MLQDIAISEYTFLEYSQKISVKKLKVLRKPQSDHFIFKINIETKNVCTKKDVLAQIAKIYRPLGLIDRIITKSKIFMQHLGELKIKWHKQLTASSLREWKNLLIKLIEINDLTIPRYVLSDDIASLYLHGFADS